MLQNISKKMLKIFQNGSTDGHRAVECPLVDPSDVVNSSLRVLTLCLAAIVVPCEQLCVCLTWSIRIIYC